MRFTRSVSVWPVGLVGGLMVERPLVNHQGKVYGFLSGWQATRRAFPMDMAGFAINSRLLMDHLNATFSYDVGIGFQESHLLEQLTTMAELEPKADLCTKVLVWHTQTAEPKLKKERLLWQQRKVKSDQDMIV